MEMPVPHVAEADDLEDIPPPAQPARILPEPVRIPRAGAHSVIDARDSMEDDPEGMGFGHMEPGAAKGLQVIGPTRLYGYTAQVEHASAADEMRYIDAVRHRFYSGLLDMPVPVSTYNFDTYGASTTPTLVLLDRAGKVAWYHPGAVPYGELRGEIEKVAR